MRALLVVVLLGGCFGVGSKGTRPGVMPMLSELPADAAKRDAVLESSAATAGPEHRKGMTKKQRQAETAAATAAAIIGSMFSTTQSVTIGGASQFDENELIAPQAVPRVRPSSEESDEATRDGTAKDGTAKDGAAKDGAAKDGAAKEPAADDAGPSNADLVPWIKLK